MPIVEGEYYHVFNRGVEKRDIFLDSFDLKRFLESMRMFNSEENVGSIFEQRHSKKHSFGSLTPKTERMPLVDVVCYCLNPNHFHMILYQKSNKAIQRFMQRLGTGYTNYFNEKYSRSGALFQGTYKAVHQSTNEQLLHTSVYVNLNDKFGSLTPKLSASSWVEYQTCTSDEEGICAKRIILEQFALPQQYESFAKSSLSQIVERKRGEKEMQWLLD